MAGFLPSRAMVDVEHLLNLADELARCDDPRPDFPLPKCDLSGLMELKEDAKGLGWYAKRDIAAGALLLVAKPLATVMGWEEFEEGDEGDDDFDMEQDDMDDDGPQGARVNGMLVLRLARAISGDPSMWTRKLTKLFPRDTATAAALPVWMCRDPAIGLEIEQAMRGLQNVPALSGALAEEISVRLPLIVRYNVLSVETAPELFIHPGPGGHSRLSATALYEEPSYFNHHCRPNVSRWAVGDVAFFVLNRPVRAGEELCISYLEHEVLCESATRRSVLLDMDFADEDGEAGVASASTTSSSSSDEAAPDAPVVDDEVQQELMSMPTSERLEAILKLIAQATGDPPWFRCDEYQLRILLALTLDGLGRAKSALTQWESCLAFAKAALPPIDEATVALRVQAALSARAAGRHDVATAHAAEALRMHSLLFGGGCARFRRRYVQELNMPLRPESTPICRGDTVLDALWPLPSHDTMSVPKQIKIDFI